MLKDITLGQFFPGDSLVHRADPRLKIILTFIYIVCLFLAKGVVSYAILFACLLFCIINSKIQLKSLFSGLRPLIIILLFTVLLNLFYSGGEIVWSWWIFKITNEGIRNAVYMLLRIVFLIMATFMLTYTTSPIMLTDAIESLFSPLKKIKIPVHELAMMMTIALRFIPTLIEETDKIMSAQKARGADFDTGNLIEKARALVPLLIPLFVSAFRRADELATAMECRCYHGGEGRTKYRQLHFKKQDYIGAIIGIILLGLIITLHIWGL